MQSIGASEGILENVWDRKNTKEMIQENMEHLLAFTMR